MSDSDTATRLVGTGWDEHGNDTAQSVLTGTNLKVRALCLTTPDLVVPVLFVPGIMGTRLKVKNRDASAWYPPENTWDGLVTVLKHLNDAGYMSRPAWTLMHHLPPYASAPRMPDLSVAERTERTLINIPSSPRLGRHA